MEMLMDLSVIRIHLKTAKKNDRMDVCSRYLKMVRNSVIIINKLFETIYYFPESFSNHEVQSCMQRNSHRTFPSLHKCICSLNQQIHNVVLVNAKCAYAMEETDCLVKILMDLSNKYKHVIDVEYDAVKNCLQDKNILENGQEDVRVKHTDNFENMVDSGNNKCQSQEKKNTMQKRQKVLKPRSKIKDEFDKKKYFLNLEEISLFSIPIFRIRNSNRAVLMALVTSDRDPYSLCKENVSFGEIVYDGEGPTSAVPQPQPSHQTNTRNAALPNTTVSNDNPTQGRRLEESSNSESVPSYITSAHEQHGTQHTFISSGRMSGSEHVNVLNNDDGIRCPQYQAYQVRLSTFTKWPSDMTQTPERVAMAGFYYTGLQDAVRCFACDGGLQNWDPEDDPWIEHSRRFPQCLFVRRLTEESDEDDAVVHSTFQRNNPMAHPPDLQELNLRKDTDIRRIQRENESLKSIVTCIKCKVQSRNILFLPCTHHCLCQDCAENCSLCPVCYTIVNKKIRTFMI